MHQTNTHTELPVTALLSLALAGFVAHAQLPIVSVDMIPGNGANNIDATVNAVAGQPLTVNLVLWPGAGGVTAYGVSAQFDNTELTYINDTEPLPAGFAGHITAGSAGWTANVALNTDQVSNFEAQTAFGVAGPVNGPWLVIGTISFTVGTPLNNGIADITPGFFHFSDAMLDNTYASLNPVFNSGFVIPEPGVISIRRLMCNTAELSWTGGGTLQEATAVTGPWTTSALQLNPQVIACTGAGTFYRTVYLGVHSINVVGYWNSTLKAGWNLIANPLDYTGPGGNTVASLFDDCLPDGTCVYKFVCGAYLPTDCYSSGFGWDDPSMVLTPGEGAFVQLPGTADTTITFVGDVKQGHLVTPLCKGFNMVSSKVPQAGLLQTDLNYVPDDGDVVYRHTKGGGYYTTFLYSTLFDWDPMEPVVEVGEAIWILKENAGTWVRNFVVN